MIVVGGDGCLFGVAWDLVCYKVLLLGVNRGCFGFFIDIYFLEIEVWVSEVLVGEYSLEYCFFLEIEFKWDGCMMGVSLVLNDVVFYFGSFVKMLEFELFVDGDFVYW